MATKVERFGTARTVVRSRAPRRAHRLGSFRTWAEGLTFGPVAEARRGRRTGARA